MTTKEKATHTPGPWTAAPSMTRASSEFGLTGEAEWSVHGPDRKRICAVAHAAIKINARLIAAAPELLSAMKSALEAIDRACDGNEDINQDHEIGNACRALQAGVAKAEGR